jgi:CDP-diacylglycerol--glycerol-3-phosphate 3-phosphatidyltransferase
MRTANKIPFLLTVSRGVLAPVVLAAALWFPSKPLFGACLVAAFLSDIFDGVIARRLNIATANLRRLDSVVDSLFYVCATAALWLLDPEFIRRHAVALCVLVALELTRYAFDWLKFRREASYHMWSSKVWGILLFVGFFSLLALGEDGVVAALPIYAGIVADLEGLAISIIMPVWKADVKSFVHALRYRDAINVGQGSSGRTR